LRAARVRRGWFALNRSPLARKIIIFNLMALLVMVAGVMFMNPFRDSLVLQREQGMVTEAQLAANIMQARLVTTSGAEALKDLAIGSGVEIFLFDATGALVARDRGVGKAMGSVGDEQRSTVITDFLNAIWDGVSGILSTSEDPATTLDPEQLARDLFARAQVGETAVNTARGAEGGAIFSVATPVMRNGVVAGVVALTSAEGEIDRLVRFEREQVLQMFVIALLVSIGLSLVLASTIANPLSDLAAAAELGRDRDARKMAPGRVRIPDLTARPDEIGRLSVAMRGMVAALYDRIDANEQFAADVSHEIKNPLASLRSAVGTLRVAKREDHREKLLDVIEHDVRRLDRLVSDISNASRLDSELVKEEEESFNLLKTLSNLTEFLGKQAGDKGVEFITDLPDQPIVIRGLEARLAQVFVNLITNATSFCEDGDAVRVWARKRDNRVLVVVEDTGPGIPEQALTKVFKRFYSERPVDDFGNHSGLGLAISKQIVEAHGGVIWAENIRPTNADITSDPLGARFVVGLPV
jgi:two-component system, OmpR family, sensor histidine kinase ChvG